MPGQNCLRYIPLSAFQVTAEQVRTFLGRKTLNKFRRLYKFTGWQLCLSPKDLCWNDSAVLPPKRPHNSAS